MTITMMMVIDGDDDNDDCPALEISEKFHLIIERTMGNWDDRRFLPLIRVVVLVRLLQTNGSSRMCLYIKRFVTRNGIMLLWRQTSPKICRVSQ